MNKPKSVNASAAAHLLDGKTPFADFNGLCAFLPMYGQRMLRQLITDGIIPRIRPPHSRKLAFHLPSVEAVLLKYQNDVTSNAKLTNPAAE